MAPARPPTPERSRPPTPRTVWVDALIADSFERLPAEPGHPATTPAEPVAAVPEPVVATPEAEAASPIAPPPATAPSVSVAAIQATGSATMQPATAPVPQLPPPALARQRQTAAALPHEVVPADPALLTAIERLQARIREVRDAAAPAAPRQAAPIPATKPAAFKAAAASADTRVVGGQGVTVRSGPSTASGRLFALANGQQVTVIGTKRGWLQIVDKRGRKGWAYSRYFKS